MPALVLAALVAAQAPSVFVNARLDVVPAAGLETALRGLLEVRPQPAWAAWEAPGLAGNSCCYESVAQGEKSGWCCGGCRLEGRGVSSIHVRGSASVSLEGPPRIHVLVRFDSGRLDRVRHYSAGCALDAGGLPVHWLQDVRPAESAALLEGLARGTRRLPVAGSFDTEPALAALARHADPSVDAALERLAASGPLESRKHAVFWLGEARGRPGYEALVRLLRGSAGDELREHAVFALSQSEVPEAMEAMIGVARRDHSPEVRGKALFWLAQKAGRKAAAAITDAIREDPETQVKEQAVFALSQLPPEQGVPLLVGLARANANPAVRERAIFWLGQSEDPRALAFFEEVLAR